MEIILGRTAGFCYGVKNAVENVKKELEKQDKLYCLGELVHNSVVIEKLEKSGLITIDKKEKAKGNVVIRAHGVQKQIYEKAKQMGINVLDYTCPNVLKIHKTVEEYANKGFYVILIGAKTHAENIGTISFCTKNSGIIENEEEINKVVEDVNKSDCKNVLIIVQTTFGFEKFNEYVEKIIKGIRNKEIIVKNTICNATKVRQEETAQIAKRVEAMIIIGGKKSSNTQKLYDIAKRYCNNTQIVEKREELNNSIIENVKKIGIMAGASTPKESINEVIESIQEQIGKPKNRK